MNGSRCNVMLVHDDPFEIDLARRAAVESRARICLNVAKGCDALLNWFGAGVMKPAQAPNLILLDLQLPGLEGMAALRRMREHQATHDIPIVVYSTEYTQQDVLMSYRAGANSFVAKPADLQNFIEFFRKQLDYWISPAHPSAV